MKSDEPTNGAQKAKSTEYHPIHNTGASDAKMEMAVNLDTMLFVNQRDKRANVPLHAVTNSTIITWTGKPITNNMDCTGTVTYNPDLTGTVIASDLCSRSLTGDLGGYACTPLRRHKGRATAYLEGVVVGARVSPCRCGCFA